MCPLPSGLVVSHPAFARLPSVAAPSFLPTCTLSPFFRVGALGASPPPRHVPPRRRALHREQPQHCRHGTTVDHLFESTAPSSTCPGAIGNMQKRRGLPSQQHRGWRAGAPPSRKVVRQRAARRQWRPLSLTPTQRSCVASRRRHGQPVGRERSRRRWPQRRRRASAPSAMRKRSTKATGRGAGA